jgi:CheY-like chemotaxis protein
MSDQPETNTSPILVVHDDANFLSLMRLILVHAGFNNVITAFDGKEALDICHTQPVALIVLDTMMPVMDGWDMLRALYGDPAMRHIPVIMASAERAPETVAKATDLGASDYVMLPCHPNEVTEAVRRVLPNTAA